MKHISLAQSLFCVSYFSFLLFYLLLLFFPTLPCDSFPLFRCVLDELKTVFLKSDGEPSLPLCFRIYAFSL